jgi:hypothetical protein
MFTMTRLARTAFFIFICIFFLTQQTYAQEPVEVKIYRTQLIEFHTKAKAMAQRVEREVRIGTSEQAQLDTVQELFALVKQVNSVTHEALSANLRGLKSGRSDNKDLLLIGLAGSTLTLILDALTNYSNTRDKAFLGIAKDSEKLFESIKRLL